MSRAVAHGPHPEAATPAGPPLWLLGPSTATSRAARNLRHASSRSPRYATSQETLAATRPGDIAILAGLSPQAVVETTDALLAQGVTTVIDVTESPAIGRALGQQHLGGAFVVLRPRRRGTADAAISRLRDIVLAGGALLALAPLLAPLAVLVKRSSPGPVFFSTMVVGRDGKTFTWRKLRTMLVGAPADDIERREAYRRFLREGRVSGAAPEEHGFLSPAPTAGHAPRKLVDERRVTRLGRFLRRHSIDELPQLWNVLRGEMTLVGPRPCLPYEYELQEPWQRRRFRVTPGLTGPWQAYGRSALTFDEMALMDYCYGHLKSFSLDARLILRTVRVVLTGEGGK